MRTEEVWAPRIFGPIPERLRVITEEEFINLDVRYRGTVWPGDNHDFMNPDGDIYQIRSTDEYVILLDD